MKLMNELRVVYSNTSSTPTTPDASYVAANGFASQLAIACDRVDRIELLTHVKRDRHTVTCRVWTSRL